MTELDATAIDAVLKQIRIHAQAEQFRVTQHAQQEMAEEDITLADVLEAIDTGIILENYPQHQRAACCLITGQTTHNRHVHIVCTTTGPTLIIITVYEPKPPKWPTPTERRRKDEM
jgi:hypothetical protein